MVSSQFPNSARTFSGSVNVYIISAVPPVETERSPPAEGACLQYIPEIPVRQEICRENRGK